MHVALRQDLGGFVLEETQRLVERADGTPLILTALSCWKRLSERGTVVSCKVATRAQRHQLPVRAGDVDVLQLLGVEPVDPLNLRDHLVAAAGDIEPVDKVAAQHGADIGAHLLQVEPQVGDLVAIDDEFGLRLVDLDVDERRESEHAALHGLELELLARTRGSGPSRRSRR